MSASAVWANACQQAQRAAHQPQMASKSDAIALAVSLCEFWALNSRVSGGCADLP